MGVPMIGKVVRLGLAATVGLPAVLFLSPAWGAGTCDVFSNTPVQWTRTSVGGTGGRANCTSTVSVKTALKYDRFGPDPIVDTRSGQVINVTWTPTGCAGRQSYYTNTDTSSGQVSGSLNRTLSC